MQISIGYWLLYQYSNQIRTVCCPRIERAVVTRDVVVTIQRQQLDRDQGVCGELIIKRTLIMSITRRYMYDIVLARQDQHCVTHCATNTQYSIVPSLNYTELERGQAKNYTFRIGCMCAKKLKQYIVWKNFRTQKQKNKKIQQKQEIFQ